MKSILNAPVYPFFIGIYPIVFLAARNAKLISVGDPLRPMLLVLGLTAIFLPVFRFFLKDWTRSALLISLLLILFFSFGHAAGALPQVAPLILGGIWLAIFLAGGLLILLRFRSLSAAPVLNSISFVLVGISIVSFAFSEWSMQTAANQVDKNLAQARGQMRAEAGADTSAGPNIYYIILDSYERGDALQKYYHFDNSSFLQALKQRGFYIATQSRSNYLTTMFALPAALNLVYLNELSASSFTKTTSNLQNNHVADFLRSRGYQVVHFESGFSVVDRAMYDIWRSPFPQSKTTLNGPITQFELLLLRTSPGFILFGVSEIGERTNEDVNSNVQHDFEARRSRIDYAFEHVPDYAAQDGHYFVFAHLVTPHNPYLYGPNGETLNFDSSYFLFGNKINPQQDIRLYTGQLQYVNRRVLQLIDRILSDFVEPPVIVIQADHGHDTFFEWDAVTPEGADLRTAILTAYYFPDGDYSSLYTSVSPVNTFRLVFNKYFDTHYPLLPDRTYGHPHPIKIPANVIPDFIDFLQYFHQIPE